MASPRDYKNAIIPNWCPGCGDFGIQNAIQAAVAERNIPFENLALISGIGCSSRIGGYLYCYGAHTTHGRALPFAQGIKGANKDLHVLVCSGDGDSYAIGLGHAMHAMKRNMNITYLVFDNQVYGLTKGQTSPRSPKGFVTKTTPLGNWETPLSVIPMAIACGCTFVAQSFALDRKQLSSIIGKALDHKGFSYVNIFTPCVTFNHFNTFEWYKEHLKTIEDVRPDGYNPESKAEAMQLLVETDSLVTGVIYEDKNELCFEDTMPEGEVPPAQKTAKPDEAVFADLCRAFR